MSVHSFASTSIEKIMIPDSVTKICEGCFCWCGLLTSIEFSENSKIEIIDKYAFNGSALEYMSIPSSIVKMDGFCSELYSLNKINVIQKNNVNIKYDKKILFGKSDIKKDDFDIILFGNRDINHIKIDSNIKRLASFAFEHCSKLNKVDIDNNSQLQFIDENALSCTSITSFFVPLTVTMIKKNALSSCNGLLMIEVSNPDLLKIDKECDLNNLSEKTIIMIAVKIKLYYSYFIFLFNKIKLKLKKALVAQSVERRSHNPKVVCSSHAQSNIFYFSSLDDMLSLM